MAHQLVRDPVEARRAASFGSIASHYERFRPGPPDVAVEWLLPDRVATVVDLGAGTGGLTRLLVDRADEVVAIEPDDAMREVLQSEVPGVRALSGRGESMPLADGSADAVLASSSWHWVDPVPALHEVRRVLSPGGHLGAVWSGPDPDGPFMTQARTLVAARTGAGADGGDGDVSDALDGPTARALALEIPPGVPFEQPEQAVFTWNVALNADQLIGLLGTMSWVILLEDERRERLFSEARRLLAELLGVEGDVTVDVDFRADAFRARPLR